MAPQPSLQHCSFYGASWIGALAWCAQAARHSDLFCVSVRGEMPSSHLHRAGACFAYSRAVRHVLTRALLLQGVREVEEWMSQTSGIPLEELRPHMFLLRDRDATGHLMRSATLSCSLQPPQAPSIALALQFWTVCS